MTMIRREKHEGSKKRLELKNLWKEATTEELIWLVVKSEQELVQKKAWKKLKASGELIISVMYDLVYGPEFIQEELSRMFIEKAGLEDCFEAMDLVPSFFEKAEKKLFKLLGTKKLRANKGSARNTLMKVIERIPPSREKAFQRFLKLNPSQTDLRKVHDMEAIQNNPTLLAIIQKAIRKAAKNDHGNKRVQRILKLQGQLKKDQE